MTDPIKEVIPRDIPENIKPTIKYFADLLDEVVNFGSNILIWDVTPKTDGDENLPPTMLFRHFLDLIDSTSILARHATGDPAKLVARASFETSLYIQYLLEKDTVNRSFAFIVADTIRLIKTINNLLPDTKEGGKTHQTLKEEFSFSVIPEFHVSEAKEFIEGKESLLEKPQYKIAYDEFKRLKIQGKGNTKWYGYFNGPGNIETLARHLNQWSIYEIMYRKWSGAVHGTDIYLGKVLSTEDPSRVDIVQLRFVKDVQDIVAYSLIMSVQVFRIFISSRIPQKMNEFIQWYLLHKKHIEQLTSKQLIIIT
jgi:hypothetical protein